MIEKLLEYIQDWSNNLYIDYLYRQSEKKLGGASRSPLWGQTKREFEKLVPKKCSIITCKVTDGCELHHCIPFHLRPDLERDFKNLRWFCRRHHFEVAHLFSFFSYCEDLDKVLELINNKIKSRPTKERTLLKK